MIQVICCSSLLSVPGRAGAFSRDFTTSLAPECRAFSGALKIEKLKAPLIPGPEGAVDTNDWCIIFRSGSANSSSLIRVQTVCKGYQQRIHTGRQKFCYLIKRNIINLQLEFVFLQKTDVSPLFVVRNIKISLNLISN